MSETKFRSWFQQYGPEFVRRAAEMSDNDEEIAQRCGICAAEFRSWRKKYPEFEEAVRLGKSESDFYVIQALHKRAVGFNVGVQKTYKLKRIEFDPETGKKLREYEELATGVDEDYIEPDLRAEIFWLKNRLPERWSERGVLSCDEESIGGIVEIPMADTIDGQDSISEPPLVK